MKNTITKKIIFALLILYIVACYFKPELIRLRFFLSVSAILALVSLWTLGSTVVARILVCLIFTSAFFLKLFPAPYSFLIRSDIPMSISLIATLLYLFVIIAAAVYGAGVISDFIQSRKNRTKENS